VKKPLLSVCIITYNHARYIQEAIDSLLVQEVNFEWELIIADDCSTDGTRDILLDYKKKYPQLIKLILQKSNVGPEKNWLDLLAYPKSKYVLYAEGDDYLIDPTKLQRQVDFLEAHPDFSMCFHPVKVVYEDGSRADGIFPSPELRAKKSVLGLDDLLVTNFIQTNSVMYRWQFIDKNVKDVFPKSIAPGDWFLHLLHAQAGKIGFMNRVMAVYRRHPAGVWWEADNNIDLIWKKHGVAHLAFYAEVLQRYGTNEARRAITYAAIYKMLDTFMAVDKKYQTQIFGQSIERFSAIAEAYAAHTYYKLQDAEVLLEQRRLEIDDLKQAKQSKVWHYEAVVKQKEQELSAIKNSRLWKLRNRLAKLLGRPT
jgi:glycosyltransferase involved in cell wall biosynthesis